LNQVLGACPLDCPDACSWVVTVDDGRTVALRGNPEHPVTRGALCVKVNRYLEQTRAADRILHPLRRVGRKGEGRFERISWGEALDEITGRLDTVIAEHGGQAIWPFHGTGSLGYIQGLEGLAGRRFFNALGASTHDATICGVAGSRGLTYTLGTSGGMDPEDLARSRLILLWGSNPLTSGHHIWKFIQDARRDGAYVVAIDPVRTRSAAQADEHLAPLPGTDAALALGLLNVIVGMGAHDQDYIDANTLGWAEFRGRIEEFPPARVAEITGLPVDRIIALGERVARTRPTAIRATQGIQRHAGGGMALRALACLPGVTGDWALPGGGLCYSTSGHFALNLPALTRPDLLPHPVRTLVMTRLGEGLLEVDDPPVKALFVIAANPVGSNPHQTKVRRGLAREDLFTVVLEHFPTDTTDYADIVLPATMQTEHLDVIAGYGHLYLVWNEPAVAPPGECLSTSETFRQLARRMGMAEPALYESDEDLVRRLLDSPHPSLAGITVEELRERGFARLNVARPYLPFAEGFPTPSGRLEFFSRSAAQAGHDPLPGHTPPADPGEGLVLISAASHHFLNTTFGNNPELRRRAGAPSIVVHPADAAARGIADGDPVRVGNARGSYDAVAQVSDRVRPGVAATTKGHWPKLSGGATVNATVDERDSDLAHGAVFHDNRVEIAPAKPWGRSPHASAPGRDQC
jgi:anaerobic selenocysteine-containing dehydrogenase